MRKPRLQGENGVGYYHVCSRIVNRAFEIDSRSRDYLFDLMYKLADFSGVHILTWSILDNHFHLLVQVPEQPELDRDELLRRHTALYGEKKTQKLVERWAELNRDGRKEVVKKEQTALRARMGNISRYVQYFKEAFTKRYNHIHDRQGTMWESRFSSTLLEGRSELLFIVGAYVDLNPVRAGIVADPAFYRWSGYAQACAGNRRAREGLMRIFDSDSWTDTQRQYRQMLYLVGDAAKDLKGRKGFSPEEVRKVIEENGKLPLSVLLRCRCRCFTTAGALGGGAFCEDVFSRHRTHYSPARRTASRPIPFFNPSDIQFDCRTIRVVRKNAVTPTPALCSLDTPPIQHVG